MLCFLTWRIPVIDSLLRDGSRFWIKVTCAVLLGLNPGCSDGRFPVVSAKGKVVCNGQPVTSGSVSFSPVGDSKSLETGKAATATVGPDGTFVLTTYERFDGAIVGKHNVQYVGSEGGDAEEVSTTEEVTLTPEQLRERVARKTSQCVQAGELQVDVKADGENDFTIELTVGQPEPPTGE
jgi:hypothetical protein